jgi:hypothetical protein
VQISCAYYDAAAHAWSSDGVIAVGYRTDAEVDGNLFVSCATTHLSAFTSFAAPYVPTANTVNPITDAGLLRNYLDPANFVPLAVSLVGWSAQSLSLCDCVCCPTDPDVDVRGLLHRVGALRHHCAGAAHGAA